MLQELICSNGIHFRIADPDQDQSEVLMVGLSLITQSRTVECCDLFVHKGMLL